MLNVISQDETEMHSKLLAIMSRKEREKKLVVYLWHIFWVCKIIELLVQKGKRLWWKIQIIQDGASYSKQLHRTFLQHLYFERQRIKNQQYYIL